MQSYEQMFPGLFHPLASLAHTNQSVLLSHLRYPQDLLMVQSAMYGRYHITSPGSFYSLSNAWDLSQISTSATGNPSVGLPVSANGTIARFSPIYELLQLPGESTPTFSAVEPLVPYSSNDKVQTLAALLIANSSASNYGQLEAFQTPSGGTSIDGPGLVNADINSNPTVSKQISLLNQGGSTVLFGTVQILPIADSLIYVRPLYVSSSQTAFPQLQEVVVVYGGQVAMETTLGAALADVFGASVNQATPNGSSRQPSSHRSDSCGRGRTGLSGGPNGAGQERSRHLPNRCSQRRPALAAGKSATRHLDDHASDQKGDNREKTTTASSKTTTTI